jgi:hypothetical protein
MTSDDPQPQPAPATLAKKIRALKEEIPPRTVSSWTPAVAMIIEARNDGIEAAARLAEEAEPAPCVLNERNHMQGLPDPDRPGRVLHPFNHSEDPTFLPGDKVRDKRDHSGKVWRIVRRVAHLDDEMMTLRDVGDDANERTLLASSIVPHLEMVAMWQPALSPGEPHRRPGPSQRLPMPVYDPVLAQLLLRPRDDERWLSAVLSLRTARASTRGSGAIGTDGSRPGRSPTRAGRGKGGDTGVGCRCEGRPARTGE